MLDRLTNFIAGATPMIEAALEQSLPLSARHGVERLNEALRAAVFPGGKRWRPILTLLGTMTAGGSAQSALPIACAIEFLHTSSLILDDLPAMDDAQLRRGRAALHLIYGEGLAMLAALALLNQAYALLARAGTGRLTEEAARCIGTDGMIGGQAADLDIRASRGNSHALASRQLKTTALTSGTSQRSPATANASARLIKSATTFSTSWARARRSARTSGRTRATCARPSRRSSAPRGRDVWRSTFWPKASRRCGKDSASARPRAC